MPLRELLDEVATHDEPVSRLTPDRVYGVAVRQRRLAAAGRVAAVGLVAAALAGTLVATTGPGGLTDRFGGDSGTGSRVDWAGAADTDHLYATVRRCDECPAHHIGSDDGGRTWTARGQIGAAGVVGTIGGPAVIAAGGRMTTLLMSDGIYFTMVSVDGGRTWSKLVKSLAPVASAPPGSLIRCAGYRTEVPANKPLVPPATCTVDVLDLDRMVFAPLATQPDLELRTARRTQDGAIWATGRRRGDDRPAVAGSTDGGRTWTIHTIPDLPDFPAGEHYSDIEVDSRDTAAVYVGIRVWRKGTTVELGSTVYRYRLVNGAWQRLDGADGLGTSHSAASYVTPDGSHVLGEYQIGTDDEIAWWVCRPGAAGYEQIRHPAGLPDGPEIRPRADGGFVTYDRAAVYLSADGWTWRRVEVRRGR